MIYVFLADGFEEVEAIAPIDVLRRCGLEIRTVGVTGATVTGSHAIPVQCDLTVESADLSDAEAVVLPGGMPGTINLKENPVVLNCVQSAYEQGKIVAAICAAPSILGEMGLLNGREAICFPGFEDKLTGAHLSASPVCQDGNIITAKGAGVALAFGARIAACFVGAEKAGQVLASMQYIK